MNRNLFLSILNMRLDELDARHRADLMESTLDIMLHNSTWRERVECLKEVWSDIHTRQEIKRRERKVNE